MINLKWWTTTCSNPVSIQFDCFKRLCEHNPSRNVFLAMYNDFSPSLLSLIFTQLNKVRNSFNLAQPNLAFSLACYGMLVKSMFGLAAIYAKTPHFSLIFRALRNLSVTLETKDVGRDSALGECGHSLLTKSSKSFQGGPSK